MYLSFYQLKEKPFQISTDPKFLWLGEKHKEGFAVLRYGIVDNKGFLLLSGDVGTGKTTLINALLNSFGDEILVASVPDPGLEPLDFYNYVAAGFGLQKTFNSKGAFLSHFRRFLLKAHAAEKKVLLIIDEAQQMSPALLEETRLLSNIERQEAKLINIFFVGQGEFNQSLLDDGNRAIRQRITVNFNLEPLSLIETEAYINHRMHVAGAPRRLFGKRAIKKIYYFSIIKNWNYFFKN